MVRATDGLVAIMPKSKSAPVPDEEKEADLVHVLIPIYEAHLLLGIASDLEDDERYAERAKALITASRHQVDLAFKLIENLRGGGSTHSRKRGAA
jgi:hypothetical protein